MNRVVVKSYSGVITIGLEKGYSRGLISREEVVGYLQKHQKSRVSVSGVYLSASVSSCDIVLNDQIEPHLRMEFINYPKFPLVYSVFKQEVVDCGEFLMEKTGQNRVVVVFPDETVMLEKSGRVDPRVMQ